MVLSLEVVNEEFDALDMLFVGSSLVYNSIDPAIFSEQGFSIYNLGSPSAGPLFYRLITEDYLAAVKTPPKRILMHIDRVTFSPVVDNWREYRVHRYLNTPLSNEALVLRFGTYGDYPKHILLHPFERKNLFLGGVNAVTLQDGFSDTSDTFGG